MAELVLKIGSRGTNLNRDYQDGDIMCAFNARRIRCVHAQHICHRKNAGGGVGVHRDNNHVARDWFELTRQYRFERVSRTEIHRVTLATLDEEIITGPEFNVSIAGGPSEFVAFLDLELNLGRAPKVSLCAVLHVADSLGVASWDIENKRLLIDGSETSFTVSQASKEFTWVEEYCRRRLAHERHKVFGTPGSEVWYGGDTDVRDAAMDLVWNAIETKTAFREVDFPRFPVGIEQPAGPMILTIPADHRKYLVARGDTPPFQVGYFGADRQNHAGDEGSIVTAIQGGQSLRSYLWITVDDFDDAEADRLVAPELDDDDEDAFDPIMLKRRSRFLDWQSEIHNREHRKIRDKRVSVDLRDGMTPLVRGSTVQIKLVSA